MRNLFDLYHFESGKYFVFIDNVLGHSSMITVMTKDQSPIVNGCPLSTCMAGFIDLNLDDEPIFSWHENSKEIPELPFDENILLEEYKKARKTAMESPRKIKKIDSQI
jgi:hypothetical protein